MTTPTRDMTISYGGFSTSNVIAYNQWKVGPYTAAVRFRFIVNHDVTATFNAACLLAQQAFKTPYQALSVVVRGVTRLSLSHTSSTGFNADPIIELVPGIGNSANSAVYEANIKFGIPADYFGTDNRRSSSVQLMFTDDRRAHVILDGTYTANGSTDARDQYFASIVDYADEVVSSMGMDLDDFDLLEESVTNDDQNKVAVFHRKYDQQIEGRNEAMITIDTETTTLKKVTISGMYSTILDETSSLAAYESLYPAFKDAVLASAGGDFQQTTTHVETNDTDLVTRFTNVYQEQHDDRQSASWNVTYATDGRRTLTFNATYFTGDSGDDAYALAVVDFPAWTLSIRTTIFSGVAFNKRSESYTPDNTIDPPNSVIAQSVWYEAYAAEPGGALPHASIRDQNYTVNRIDDAADESVPGIRKPVTVIVNYAATIDKNVSVDLKGIWAAAKNFLLTVGVPIYTGDVGQPTVLQESPSYNPDNNQFTAGLKLMFTPSGILAYTLNYSSKINTGKIFDGIWSGEDLDYFVYAGHKTCIAQITKTYRHNGDLNPAPPIPTDIDDPKFKGFGFGSGEGTDDPFGFTRGDLVFTVTDQDAPTHVTRYIGNPVLGGVPVKIQETTISVTYRVTRNPNAVSGNG